MALKAFAGGALFGAWHGEASPSILALHGWGRNHHDFDEVLAGFDGVALDLPGFGASPEPPGVWGASEYAESVLGMMEVFDEPPVLVGHSFGGRVAVTLAAHHPDAVRSLVLIGVPLLHTSRRRRSPVRYRLIRWAHRLGIISDASMEETRQRYGSTDYRAATGVMRSILVKAVHETYESELQALTVPVQLLWGVNDSAAPLAVAEQASAFMAERGVSVALRSLEGVGHHVMAEAPDAVRAVLAEQLERRR